MEIVLGKTLHDAVIQIDNKSFVNCDLRGCTLEHAGEDVSFQMTRLRNCKYMFYGSAKRTVLFLQETGLMPFDERYWGESSEPRFDAGGHKTAGPATDGQHGKAIGYVDSDGHLDGDGQAKGRP